jgi:hypothetical protein
VSEPPAGVGSGDADVVMVPLEEDSAPPPPAGDRDVVMSAAPEASPAVGVASAEDVMDMVACRYVNFPGIGTIDLDAPEHPGNDKELLEVATERMFAEPTILETIASVASVLRQYGSVGGSAPPPRRRWQRACSRNPRPVRSRPLLRSRLHWPERTRSCPYPSPRKQQHPRLPLRWPTRC